MKKLKILLIRIKFSRALIFKLMDWRRKRKKKKQAPQKQILHNLSEILVNDPIIQINKFEGVFEVDAKSDIFSRIALEREYESELVDICLKYIDLDRDIVDVGGNIGLFTVLFAKNVGETRRVVSVEPTEGALKHLYKNLDLNKVSNKVEVFEGAISDKKGTGEIVTIKGKEEYSSLGEIKHPSAENETYTTEKINLITLDELTEEKKLRPGFIKVDVEGFEHLVFRGSSRTLENDRPIIVSELSNVLLRKNGSSSEEVVELIKSKGYDIYDPIYPSKKLVLKDYGDIICFPKELKVEFVL